MKDVLLVLGIYQCLYYVNMSVSEYDFDKTGEEMRK